MLYHPHVRSFWSEYGVALLFYTFLSLVLSWPMVRDFSTLVVGGNEDAKHNIWILWNVKEALLGRASLFYTDLLYYPHGISLLAHGMGSLPGLFALPFWPWGPVAAYNGTLLVGLVLTGYGMYLLARGLAFPRGIALFAGAFLLATPIHMVALLGHTEMVFLGLPPLALLTLHHTFHPERSGWWAVGCATTLLLLVLHSGYQFCYTVLALAFFGVAFLVRAPRSAWTFLLRRSALLAASMVVLVAPAVGTMLLVMRDPALSVDRSAVALNDSPDMLHYILPSASSVLFGETTRNFLKAHAMTAHNIVTTVSLSLTGAVLAVLAVLRETKLVRRWLLFTLVFLVFSFGPILRVMGNTTFTHYNLDIPLPFVFLSSLPGLGFMRSTGRFMLIGSIGFAIVSCFGLLWLVQRYPLHSKWIIVVATILLLIEFWPQPWPQERLPAVPRFYEYLAQDKELYGVFDLPIAPLDQSDWRYMRVHAFYEMYQMTHRKGIAGGYISRVYDHHPLFPELMTGLQATPSDMFLNGKPVNSYANAQAELARSGYRYVVWHKTLRNFGGVPVTADTMHQRAAEFLRAVFGHQRPLIDNATVRVYSPAAATVLPVPTLAYASNWREIVQEQRWAASPALLSATVPVMQPVLLRMMPYAIHDPNSRIARGNQGVMWVRAGEAAPVRVVINRLQTSVVPLVLPAGIHPISLELESGNFQLAQYYRERRYRDVAVRSFSLKFVDLITPEGFYTEDLLVNGRPQADYSPDQLVATFGTNWYAQHALPVQQSALPQRPGVDLLVYSPRSQSASLAFMPAPSLPHATRYTLLLTMTQTVSRTLPLQFREVVAAPVQLQAGWNQFSLALKSGRLPGQEQEMASPLSLIGVERIDIQTRSDEGRRSEAQQGDGG